MTPPVNLHRSARHADPLRGELLPLYWGRKRLPPVVALAAYFDESDERTPGILTVAGYVARVESWDQLFTPAWRAMLDAAPHPLTEYKHSDCRQGKREFAPPWTQGERDALTIQAVETILDLNRQDWVMGFGAGLFLDYPMLDSDERRQGFAEFALGRCFAMLLNHLLRWVEPMLGDDPLQLIFDYRNNQRTGDSPASCCRRWLAG